MSTPASVSFNRIKKEDPDPCSPGSPSSSLPASTAYIDTTTVWDMEILNSSPLMSTPSSPVFPPTGGGLPAHHRLGGNTEQLHSVYNPVVVFFKGLDAGEIVFARDRD